MNNQLLPIEPSWLDQIWQVECQAHSHPWSETMIRDLSSRGACHHALVKDNQVIGYFYAQNILGEVTLLNLAVAPQHQGQGYGKQLMAGFLAMCENSKAESAWLEVRESNLSAIHLYQEQGFNEVDRRRGYYPAKNGKEDAIVMSYFFF